MSMFDEAGGDRAPVAHLVSSSSCPSSNGEPEYPELVIRPRSGWISVDWRELYTSRELLFFLIWRDVKIRYKQTVLGIAWAVIQPLLTMLIFTIIFGRFARIPSENVPYPLFVFAGLVPWTFFSNGVTQAGQSLINQQQMLTKIYFPRLFVPTASVGAFLVDLLISFGIYACMLVFYQVAPSGNVIVLPLLIGLTILATLGLGYWLAALTILYRDFRYVLPFLLQIMLYLSPVIYPTSMLSRRFQNLLALNPMCGIIEAFRSSILGTPWNFTGLAISSVTSLGLFVFGLYFFRKTERRFADIA
jgi:lipopolysaccharide transport system permease protein